VTGAANHRGASKQDYETPLELIEAVKDRFGEIVLDLAASGHNAKAIQWIDEECDSLKQDWVQSAFPHIGGLCWLNPPFGNIAPWAKKCAEESARGCRIAFLVPASVGANWWRDYVHGKAAVYFLNGRVCFDGVNGFPKDCALCLYGEPPGYEVWTWKQRSAQRLLEVGT
jgi:phage N-6-adenine-methyltransferase